MKFFVIFRHWADVLGLLSFFWRICWNCILRVHRKILGGKMFFKTYIFPTFFGQKTDFFSELCRNKFGGVIKKEICRSKEKLLGQFFLKSYSSNLFRTLIESLPGFSNENFGVFVKTAFSLSKETFGKKFFSLQNLQFVFLENRAGKFRLTVGKYSGGFEAAFYFSRGTFRKKMSWKNSATFVDIFLRSFSVIAQEMFGGPVKTVIYVSIKTIWKEKLFWRTNKVFHRF